MIASLTTGLSGAGKGRWMFAALLVVAVFGLYGTGLWNELVFDDARLTDGSIYGVYGGLGDFRPRWLSYGTFVWLQPLFDRGWVGHRLVNVLLHVCNSAVLLAVVTACCARFQEMSRAQEGATDRLGELSPLVVRVAVLGWALNPVAVYAVAYLIQRSILMASLFALISVWALIKTFQSRNRWWLLVAVLAYVLAVSSKEHVIALPLFALGLWVVWERPSFRHLIVAGSISLGVLVLISGVLWMRFGAMVGVPFDAVSKAYTAHLGGLAIGAEKQVFALSVLNQAWLFFRYGFMWLVPYVGWMQIDLRPEFPTAIWSWPHVVGALGWTLWAMTCVWLLFRRTGPGAWVGLAMLWPTVFFLSEFAIVWIQDPFVLYRSYLWSFGGVGLVVMVFGSLDTSKVVLGLGAFFLLVFGTLTFERISSLESERAVWTDAWQKTDRSAPANAFGRWRPALNLAKIELIRGNPERAYEFATFAVKLHEPMGLAHFNQGSALQMLGRSAQALAAFDESIKQGYAHYSVFIQRGEVLHRLGQFARAQRSFADAMKASMPPDLVGMVQVKLAESANLAGDHQAAHQIYSQMLSQYPEDAGLALGLAFSLKGMGKSVEALKVLDTSLERRPLSALYHARAVVYQDLARLPQARADLAKALEMEPGNRTFQEMRTRLEKGASGQ